MLCFKALSLPVSPWLEVRRRTSWEGSKAASRPMWDPSRCTQRVIDALSPRCETIIVSSGTEANTREPDTPTQAPNRGRTAAQVRAQESYR